ncbi:DUF6807 domain-containing protein [Zavarzinella formosa]|uniref:DUF6807 domain-containing protein n=1 Tax=Zavarzinella formosa TaxID=360055 RepID=UPI0002F3FB86|nr:PmoA family protein [Zavarzinella formosa]
MRLIAFLFLFAAIGPVFAEEATSVGIKVSDGVIEFTHGKNLAGKYHYGKEVAKPYFYPLNAPPEVTVTRGWPMVKGLPKETTDHPHQKSAWFCHGDVIPEGIELKTKSKDIHVKGVDFWSEQPGHGKIECVSASQTSAKNNTVSVSTTNEWKSADGVKILDETRVIKFSVAGDARLFTVEIDIHASVCPLTFGDTKEGSFGVRVNDEIKAKGGNGYYANAQGKKNEKDVWGHLSDWNDYVGKIGDTTAGIAVFDDSSNKYRACWHSREYGLMAANPFGRNVAGFPDLKGKTDLVKLDKGEHLKLRYGILLHAGDTETAKVAEHYKTFMGK